MRPTVIRLITGGALGVAFSIALTLPGSVVFPAEAPIRQLTAPNAPRPKVVRAALMVERPTYAPARPRIVGQRVYVPTPGPRRTTSAVRHTPPPSGKPAEQAPARVEEPVTPLAATQPPPAAQPADEPKQADEQGDEPRKAHRQRKSERPRKAEKPRRSEKPKKTKKPKDHSAKKDKPGGARDEDRHDNGDDRRGHEQGEQGNGRGGRGDHG